MTTLEFNYSLHGLSPLLKPFAVRLTKNGIDAEDLIQETFLKAMSNREKYEDGTNFKAWVYTIMKNTFITQYQRNSRRKTFMDSTENLYYVNSSDKRAEKMSYNSFLSADIKRAMKKIEKVYSQPFLLYFNGFKYFEIAEKLDIPIGTVKNRIHLARKELKGILKEYQYIN